MKKNIFMNRIIVIHFLLGIILFTFMSCKDEKTTNDEIERHIEEDAIFSCPWDVGDTVLISRITENKNDSNEIIRIMSFRKLINGEPKWENIFETHDHPIAMFPTSDVCGLLVTVWTSGSAYKVRVYRYFNRQFICVLDGSSKMFPEFIYCKDSEIYPCLIFINSLTQEYRQHQMKPDSCIIMKWNGARYQSIGTFSWKKHLQAFNIE